MASKKVKIGNLIVTNGKHGMMRSLALGNKGKDPKYNISVEVVVRDASGAVIAKQTDGFVELVDPRTQPQELLSAGVISEEVANKMANNASKLSEKVKYQLMVKRV